MKSRIKKGRRAAEAALDECATMVWRLYRAGQESGGPARALASLLLAHVAEALALVTAREDVAAFLEASDEGESAKSLLQGFAMSSHAATLPQQHRDDSAAALQSGLATLRNWKARLGEHQCPPPVDEPQGA